MKLLTSPFDELQINFIAVAAIPCFFCLAMRISQKDAGDAKIDLSVYFFPSINSLKTGNLDLFSILFCVSYWQDLEIKPLDTSVSQM